MCSVSRSPRCGRADLDVERRERRQHAAGVVVGDLAGRRQRDRGAAAGAVEQRRAEALRSSDAIWCEIADCV